MLGSFAGAIGYGQFMPSSLDRWGADGDKDGRIDMVESEPDAIASVARFLTAHGWVAGRGLLYPVRADAEIFDATGSGGIAAHATVEGLRKAGVDTGEHFPSCSSTCRSSTKRAGAPRSGTSAPATSPRSCATTAATSMRPPSPCSPTASRASTSPDASCAHPLAPEAKHLLYFPR